MDPFLAIGVLIAIFVIFAAIFGWSSRIKKVGPNQVLVISGRGAGRKDEDLGEMESKLRADVLSFGRYWNEWMICRWKS
jgi:uncharacterized membrane protein YqiK